MWFWLVLPFILLNLVDGWFNLNSQPDLIERLSRRLDPANPNRLRRLFGSVLMVLAAAYLIFSLGVLIS
ncbi:hypothetical protein [Porphyrobacter sp. ULC335]|uniref:hypothetical protein n=1 Tax=Porphyrobacter sp. ULC335 TaxID=2854260 RepID=UPI00222118FA|nr:hypothetical protein [Porphyrobacter sp. ULC335]UYV14573.1 hypothetical protein KVF90_10425 [Porphyrobacter sp. ULC335]